MKAAIAALTIITAATVGVHARTVADLFKSAPEKAIPMLKPSARFDMVEYYKAGMNNPTKNAFDGNSRIVKADDSVIDIELSSKSSLQIAAVPIKADTILAVVETVLTPIPDSGLRFYRTDTWEEIVVPQLPGVAQFIDPDSAKVANKKNMPEMVFVSISYVPEENVFRFANNTEAFYTDADKPDGLDIMRKSIDLRFDGKKWKEKR